MALKAIVEDVNDVEESLREYYKQDGDKFVLQLEGVREHPDTLALRNAYEKEQEKRREAAKERDRLKEIADKVPEDFDPDRYEQLIANGDGGEDVQKKVEEARERERKRHEKTINELKAERDQLKSEYSQTKTQTALKDALSEINVAPHLRRAAERIWGPDTQLDEDGNIVTKDGTPLPDAVKAWAQTEEGQHFVAAAANSGGGAPGGRNGGGATPNPWKKDSKNLTEQMRLEKAEPEKAKRLKAEAGAA